MGNVESFTTEEEHSNQSCNPATKNVGTFDIRNHVDYDKHMKNFVRRDSVEFKKIQQKAAKLDKASSEECDIRSHPQYQQIRQQLLKTFARKVENTCPPEYEPCASVEQDPRYQKMKNHLKVLRDKIVEQETEYKNNPEYQNAKKELKNLKKLLKSQSETDDQLAVAKKYLSKMKKEIQRLKVDLKGCEPVQENDKYKALKKRVDVLEAIRKDIKKHPEYMGLMKKYGHKDTSVCPPVYKPRKCDNIEQHPKYLALKKQIKTQEMSAQPEAQAQTIDIKNSPEYLNRVAELKKSHNLELDRVRTETELHWKKKLYTDIKSHPGYSNLVQSYENRLAVKDTLLKNGKQNGVQHISDISKHPEYQRLMNKYVDCKKKRW